MDGISISDVTRDGEVVGHLLCEYRRVSAGVLGVRVTFVADEAE